MKNSRYPLVTSTLTVTKIIDGNPSNKRLVQKECTFFDRLYGNARKVQLRFEADERRKEWQKLTPQQQLEILNHRAPNGAKKQRAKIQARIEADQKKKDKKNKAA
jgi:hypothetical protein